MEQTPLSNNDRAPSTNDNNNNNNNNNNDFAAWIKLAGDTWAQAHGTASAGTELSAAYSILPNAAIVQTGTANLEAHSPTRESPYTTILPDLPASIYAPQRDRAKEDSPSITRSSATESGSESSFSADASQNIAEGTKLYQEGDIQGAFNYFMKAAQEGDSRAQLQVGFFYEKGQGVPADAATAAQWYQKAAENSVNPNAQAMKNLGQMFENGNGVSEDWTAAAKWYQKGAQMGNVNAEAALARAYQFGVGVPQDRDLAIQWDQKAAADGDSDSGYWANRLSDPTNNIGFRTQEEQDLVIGNHLRTSSLLIGGDPAWLTFHNNADRMAWVQKFKNAIDVDEASGGGNSFDPSTPDYTLDPASPGYNPSGK